MDLKCGPRHKNGHSYVARGSFVLLRSKNGVNILTQSAENRICMGKWAFEILGELFLKNEKASDDRTFLHSAYATVCLGSKKYFFGVLVSPSNSLG